MLVINRCSRINSREENYIHRITLLFVSRFDKHLFPNRKEKADIAECFQ